MKFINLALLIASASAAVGTDCSSDKTVCASTECCGTAKPDKSVTDNPTGMTDKTICNTKDATAWTKEGQTPEKYTFSCNTDTAKKTGGIRLAAGASFVALASYYMA